MQNYLNDFNIKALFTWQSSDHSLADRWLHPCRVEDVPHLIHHPQLEITDPEYFAYLKKYAQYYQWVLRPDRRGGNISEQSSEHSKTPRRKWLPTFLLAFSITTHGFAHAQDSTSNHSQLDVNTRVDATLHAMSAPSNQTFMPDAPTDIQIDHKSIKTLFYDRYWHHRIGNILKEHWQPSAHDPSDTASDLDGMARYFSQFPAVIELFTSIENSKWWLKYSPKTYETQIQGNQLSVDSALVLFDPRSAAQFKFYRACTDKIPHCVAAPADVLLHELLHVQTAINDSRFFISQGGMSDLMYPYEHERMTIQAEKKLYQSMTLVDQHPRPLRSEHSGRHVLAACVTCLQ